MRHILIVTALFLIVLSSGAVIIGITREVKAMALSGKTAVSTGDVKTASTQPLSGPEQSSAVLAAVTSVPTSSASVPSASSREPSSAQSGASSSRSSQSAAASKPMDPATYQAMYPDLYAEKVPLSAPEQQGKVVYLTFDDGPSNLTLPLLDVLDRYHVKATFFLVGKTDSQDLKAMKAIVDRGHGIGVHSYTHNLPQIYANPAAFLDDFKKMHDLIQTTTGVDTRIYRFAGGSVNSYNRTDAKAIITEMNRRGYLYYDWNVSSEDAVRGTSASQIYNNVIRGVHAHSHSMVLCHNTSAKGKTLAEIPKILETLQKEGYVFKTLDSSVDNAPYIFRVPAN